MQEVELHSANLGKVIVFFPNTWIKLGHRMSLRNFQTAKFFFHLSNKTRMLFKYFAVFFTNQC